jgi:hypothetical protein
MAAALVRESTIVVLNLAKASSSVEKQHMGFPSAIARRLNLFTQKPAIGFQTRLRQMDEGV